MSRIDPIIGSRQIHDSRPSVSDQRIVYVIPDIHGQANALASMRRHILERTQRDGMLAYDTEIVYLGDYVGHGPSSADVIDIFVSTPLKGIKETFLLGDQDLYFMNFALGRSFSMDWLYKKGGQETLESYGLEFDKGAGQDLVELRQTLMRVMPDDHIEFLKNLSLSHSIGDYFFVHAGVRPDQPLERQSPKDLISIGDVFLYSRRKYKKIVVHGHNASLMPFESHNRIGVHTNPCSTGVFTALRLNGVERQFIQVSNANKHKTLEEHFSVSKVF